MRSIDSAPAFASNAHLGGAIESSDTPAPRQVLRVTHDGQSNFIVWHHRNYLSDSSDSDLVANAIGVYSATRPFRAGPALIEITADGNWSIGP